MGFTIGPLDNTIKSAMTMPTQIQYRPLVSHTSPTFQIKHGNLLLPLQPRENLPPTMNSSPLVDEGVSLSTAWSVVLDRPSCPCLPRCAFQAWLVLQPLPLHTTVAASKCRTRPTPRLVAIARPADASVSHTTLNDIPYSAIALRTSRA